MNKERINILLHLIAGLVVLFHGFDSLETGDLLAAAAYMGFAILFIIVAGLHKSIYRLFFLADPAFYTLEALTILYSGWHYKTLKHNNLYYFHLVCGIILFIFAIVEIYNADKPRKKRRRKSGRRRSSLFDENKPVQDGGA